MVSRTVRAGTSNLTNRERWLEQILPRIPAGSRILDAGEGELRHRRFFPHLNYVRQDFAQYNGQGDGKGLQTEAWDQSRLDIVSDITSIPEADASCDAVTCIEVLEHEPYPIDALGEISRLMKPGGTPIVTAPFCSLTHFAPRSYQTGYSRYAYEYWSTKLGFDIEEMKWNGNYFEYLAQELQRLPSIAKEYSHTRLNPTIRMLISCFLNVLGRLSKQDEGSNQLLCYGLHISARKSSA